MNQDTEIDLLELVIVIRKKIVWVILLTIVCGGIGLGASIFLINPKYSSDATLIVNANENTQVVTSDQINTAKQLIDTYSVILKSETVMKQVIEALDLRDISGWENITPSSLSDLVYIGQVESTQVIKVEAITADQNISNLVVKQILKLAPEVIIRTVKAGSVEVVTGVINRGEVSPNVLKNTAAGGLLGFILAIGLIFIRYFFDRTIKSEEDIESILKLNVIATIPSVKEGIKNEKK